MTSSLQFFWWFDIALAVFVGLIAGSFSTMLTYRIPRGLSLGRIWRQKDSPAIDPNRSRCPSCEKQLCFWDLIPVFSWLFLKGRCRHCSRKIGITYLSIELSCVILSLAALYYWGHVNAPLFILWSCIPIVVAMVAIDLRHMILPDILNTALAFFALGFHFLTTSLDAVVLYAAAGVVYSAFSYGLRWGFLNFKDKEALGLGDVKFFFVAGLWLGFSSLPLFLMMSGIFGMIFGISYKRITGQERFPFGPALIASLIVAFTFPSPF